MWNYIKAALILLVVALLGYMGWQYLVKEIKVLEVKGDIEKTLYGEIRSDEYVVMERTLEKLRERNIYLEYQDILIEKTQGRIHVEFSYTDSITIPFIKKSFYFEEKINTTVSPM
ncbi:MAG: hypothetical protein PHW02_02085 [bacterium]|nr:hypothetical protein [bacterium]